MLTENIGENLYNLSLSKVLRKEIKTMIYKGKNKYVLCKSKNIFSVKGTVMKMKKQRLGENICNSYIQQRTCIQDI